MNLESYIGRLVRVENIEGYLEHYEEIDVDEVVLVVSDFFDLESCYVVNCSKDEITFEELH